MAARLGIARPTWNRIRNGRLPLTGTLAIRAAGVWPELSRDLLDRADAASRSVLTADKTESARAVADASQMGVE